MIKLMITAFVMLICVVTNAQDIFGNWKTIDDETGKERSIVSIYEQDGKVFGKIVKISDPAKRDKLCINCEGDDYNAPILGLVIIKDMEKVGDAYKKGNITNPDDGEIYDCRLKLMENPNQLQVRGYIAFFYRTQYWVRAD